MTAVLDVSAGVQILFQKEDFLKTCYAEYSYITAPDLYISEITNVFWKYNRAKLINEKDCLEYISDGIELIDNFVETK